MSTSKPSVTLDEVMVELEAWRHEKKASPSTDNRSIPDGIWRKVFQLQDRFSDSKLKKLFGLNSAQYRKKYNELCEGNNVASQTEQTVNFCEATVSPEYEDAIPDLTQSKNNAHKTTTDDLKNLRSNDDDYKQYIDGSATVVECIHPNGARLKIYTTTNALFEVMSSFYRSGKF